MPRSTPRWTRWAVAATVLTATAASGGPDTGAIVGPPLPPLVDYDEGRVSVNANGEPLSALLQRLADAAGMQVRGKPCADPPVTARFVDVPLRSAVERLLGECNFTMRFGADRAPRRLTFRGAPAASRRPAHRSVASGRSSFFRRWASHPPLSVDGALATALGARRVRLPQLARATGTPKNVAIRSQARQRLLAAIEADPMLRAGLRDMTPADLMRFARNNARSHASELAVFLSRRARDPSVRTAARAALSGLR